MAETFRKLGLLLWKNLLIQVRSKKKLAVDLLIPLLIGALLFYIRYAADVVETPNVTTFKPFRVDYIPEPLVPGVQNISQLADIFATTGFDDEGDGDADGSLRPFSKLSRELFDPFATSNSSVLEDYRSAAKFARRPLTGVASLAEAALTGKWFVMWSPDHPKLRQIMAIACEKMNAVCNPVKDSKSLEKYLTKPVLFPEPRLFVLAGVAFPDELEDGRDLPKDVTIKLRFPAELRFAANRTSPFGGGHWLTSLVYPLFQVGGPRDIDQNEGGRPGYYKEGFLGVQNAISSAFVELYSGREDSSYDIRLKRVPYPPFILDPLLEALKGFLPFLVVLAFLFSVKNFVTHISMEKERGLQAVMNIMGLSNWLRWTSWFIYAFLFFLLYVIIFTVALKVSFLNKLALFPHSDWSCLFLFFCVYSVAAITFCFLMSTLFSRATTASIVSGMVWFLVFIPFYVVQPRYEDLGIVAKSLCCFFLNTGMSVGLQIILMHEGAESGFQWHNMWTPATPDDDMTMGAVIIIMLVIALLQLAFALYIENVLPGKYGTPLPFYYPFMRSYWRPRNGKGSSTAPGRFSQEDCEACEAEDESVPAAIEIRNLTKTYGRGRKPAVNNLSLRIREGQLTALMGFNGAGKTTTLSILTGVYPPTSGTAMLGGYDVTTNMTDIRKSLGYCPQYNILFDELTVEEHVKFYTKLKGLRRKEIRREIDKYLTLLNLTDKRRTQSKFLSGGMKRKLSVALALCGNAKIVLLDEPTAGMDPRARRSLWDLILAEKKGRSMLMTTHFLDEADLLGDKVAIMSEGRLRCHGSTFYLKKKFNSGYHLVMIKDANCDVQKVTDVVYRNVGEYIRPQDIGKELSYQLPEKYSGRFEGLFKTIEERKESLQIISFGVSPTTLEDVFMRIASSGNQGEGEGGKESAQNVEASKVAIPGDHTLRGRRLLASQTAGLFYKHYKIAWKAWYSHLLLIAVAVGGVVCAIVSERTNKDVMDLPPRYLDLRDYAKGVVAVKKSPGCTPSCVPYYNAYDALMDKERVEKLVVKPSEPMEDFLLAESDKSVYKYRMHYLLGTAIDGAPSKDVKFTAWFNGVPFHLPPVALSYVYNSILKVKADASLTFVNEPLPYKEETKAAIQGSVMDSGFQISIFIAFAFVFITPYYLAVYIHEKEIKAKLLQYVSGVSAALFWTTAYVWNLFLCLGPTLAVVATLAAFQEEGYKTADELGNCAVVVFTFFVAMFPVVYLASLFLNKPPVGFVQLANFNTITGIFASITVMIFQLPALDLVHVADTMDWIFAIFPLYSMARCLNNISTVSKLRDLCKSIYEDRCLKNRKFIHVCCRDPEQCPPAGCIEWSDSPWNLDKIGIGRYLLIMLCVGLLIFLLLLLIETKILRCCRCRRKMPMRNESPDSDVIAEREKVEQMPPQERVNYNLVIDGLSKSFRKFTAVKKMHLTVVDGECFGLLGANGAGKTTTFRMLTGDETPSSGNAYVRGHSIRRRMEKVRRHIGYCPQFDALFEELTGNEQLRLYCLLRGIPRSNIKEVSKKLADDLLFSQFLNKKVKEYSGGNKRKLSTAISLIGNPYIVYLDEPTAGMDPVAKRHLWAVISNIRAEGTTIILTSHSLEECEALCTRLTIMAKGEFTCLGSQQYLKNKYCQGYSLVIKMKKSAQRSSTSSKDGSQTSAAAEDGIKNFVAKNFPGAVKTEEHEEILVYQIPFSDVTWSRMFGLMESAKSKYDIEDYSIGQTTLEQVLLKLTEEPARGN